MVQLRFLGPFTTSAERANPRGVAINQGWFLLRPLLFSYFTYFTCIAPLKMLRGDVEIPFILIPAV